MLSPTFLEYAPLFHDSPGESSRRGHGRARDATRSRGRRPRLQLFTGLRQDYGVAG